MKLLAPVQVKECFFHCGKALIRSRLWEPERWPEKTPSIVSAHRLIGKKARDEEQARQGETVRDRAYVDELD